MGRHRKVIDAPTLGDPSDYKHAEKEFVAGYQDAYFDNLDERDLIKNFHFIHHHCTLCEKAYKFGLRRGRADNNRGIPAQH